MAVPTVVHFCGHRSSTARTSRFPVEAEDRVAHDAARYLERGSVGFGFGSLAYGADILIAEALLRRGAELHVALPVESFAFTRASVRPGGARWLPRYEQCLARAASVLVVTPGADIHPGAYDLCAQVAMGQAVLKAQDLSAAVEQLAVWDGEPPSQTEGTAHDVATWASAGRLTRVIWSRAVEHSPVVGSDQRLRFSGTHAHLIVQAEQCAPTQTWQPIPVDRLRALIGAALDAHPDRITVDFLPGRCLVKVDDLGLAAQCAVLLRQSLVAQSRGTLRMRGLAHVSLVADAPLLPLTVSPGELYVTGPLAALVALHVHDDLLCLPGGQLPGGTGPAVYVLKDRVPSRPPEVTSSRRRSH